MSGSPFTTILLAGFLGFVIIDYCRRHGVEWAVYILFALAALADLAWRCIR